MVRGSGVDSTSASRAMDGAALRELTAPVRVELGHGGKTLPVHNALEVRRFRTNVVLWVLCGSIDGTMLTREALFGQRRVNF